MTSAKRKKRLDTKKDTLYLFLTSGFLVAIAVACAFTFHYTEAYIKNNMAAPIVIEMDPNLGIKPIVVEFFTDNDAEEMLPIIECESRFKHYNSDGTVLKNRNGSSATGVAQILASTHPDPKALEAYNKRNNTDLTVDDFDITTLTGNLGYALVLYEIRGTKDWECADLVAKR